MAPVLILIALSASTLVILLWMHLRLAKPRAWQTDLGVWWKEFDPSRYDSMSRVLSRRDIEFLRTLPGFRPGMEQRLRRQRLRVFQSYLRSISMDFHRLHALGSELATASMSPDLHNELFRQRIRFSRAMWRIRLELIVYRAGIGEVDPSTLVDSLRVSSGLFEPAMVGIAA